MSTAPFPHCDDLVLHRPVPFLTACVHCGAEIRDRAHDSDGALNPLCRTCYRDWFDRG